MTIENSNFGMYLSSMQEVYKKILDTGRDVYYCGYSRDLKQVFALPARVQKSDGSIEITGEDIENCVT